MSKIAIIESPSLSDFEEERRLGPLLRQQYVLSGMRPSLSVVATAEAWKRSISRLVSEDADILQVVGHGSQEGLGLTDGTLLTWPEVELMLLAASQGRMVVVTTCRSSFFRPKGSLATMVEFFRDHGKEYRPPSFILTMFGNVQMSDATLTFGLFFRKLMVATAETGGPRHATLRQVHEALSLVRAAKLPKVCCAAWDQRRQGYRDISPWKTDLAAAEEP